MRSNLWGTAIALVTLVCLAAAVYLANFGASLAWFALLLLVPLTVGLPATVGLVLCVWLTQSPPGWGFVALVLFAGVGFQLLALQGVRRLLTRRPAQ
jgi:Mn2+/Fe2+ NRAMP family transporter